MTSLLHVLGTDILSSISQCNMIILYNVEAFEQGYFFPPPLRHLNTLNLPQYLLLPTAGS
jgi:hypothetical protein